ncbi:MAG: PaaI family thioesterase [Deltaproteobacteria bacterium]|nr:PaaI family thioesterase [Deltaproteobacteria bacterium]
MTGSKNFWTEFLDSMEARTLTEAPPHAVNLKLPPIDGWEPGRVWFTWTVDPAFMNPAGTLFGGYLSALADQILAFAVMTVLGPEEMFTTSDLRMSFFRPVTGGRLYVEGRVINRSRHMAHLAADFIREDRKAVATATATQVLFKNESFRPFENRTGNRQDRDPE